MVDTLLSNTYIYILVFVRLAGMIAFNPLFAHRNIPNMTRVAFIFMTTLIVAPNVQMRMQMATSLDLVAAMARELLAGLFLGFVFHIFYYMLFTVGDLMDTQFGMAMAKVFDPGSSIQMSMSSSLLNILFILYILATDTHLLMIRMFATSFDAVAVGSLRLSTELISHILTLYAGVFALAVRLALPFIVAEFVLEVSMGVLMKLIPQIHVFVINIQFKIFLGILLLFLFASPIASFVDNYMGIMMENMQSMFTAMT